MSFLLPEDDPQATLHDALAFIDACESGHCTSGTGGTSSSSSDELLDTDDDDTSSPSSANDQSSLRVVIRNPPSLDDLTVLFNSQHTQTLPKPKQPQQQQKAAKPTPARKKSRAHAVKKHRERKKNEMQTLREEAMQLESRLARLQRTARACNSSRQRARILDAHLPSTSSSAVLHHHNGKSLVPRASTWFDFAALREHERFQSEKLNAKLRDALRRQLLASKALDGVLSKKRVEELELLQDQQKTELRQQHDASLLITARHSEPTVLAQLQADLHRMYLLTDSVFNSDDHVNTSTTAHWTGSGSSSSMHVNETSDPVAGQCTEVRSSTTVRCSFREAGQAMWQGTSPQQTPATGPCNVVKRALTNASFQKSFNIFLDGYEKHPVGLSGSAYMHKFDEDERFMFMWTSTIALSSNGPTRFVEKGWVVVTGLPSTLANDTRPLSIVRTYYQASCPSPPQDPQALDEVVFVLKWLGRKTRDFNLRMQDVLADKYSSLSQQWS